MGLPLYRGRPFYFITLGRTAPAPQSLTTCSLMQIALQTNPEDRRNRPAVSAVDRSGHPISGVFQLCLGAFTMGYWALRGSNPRPYGCDPYALTN